MTRLTSDKAPSVAAHILGISKTVFDVGNVPGVQLYDSIHGCRVIDSYMPPCRLAGSDSLDKSHTALGWK